MPVNIRLAALGCACLIAFAIASGVWWQALRPEPPRLTVSFLDIGQGDSILIQGPGGARVIIDGGPDTSVLRELPKRLGWFGHAVDLMVETHPDKDHIAGLVDVLRKYDVSYFLEPGIPGTTATSRTLERSVETEPGLRRFIARRGMRLHLGGGAYADVLFPDRDVSHGDTNDGSIALRVVYGTTSFLMAGDLPTPEEDYLAGIDGAGLRSDVLKASHHGSRFSTSDLWLAAVHPSVVVISAGKGNRYGHPAPEVLERTRAAGARIVSTMDSGTLTFVSDGTRIAGP